MEDLIRIEERNGQQAVNARELHDYLGSRRDFSNWIKERISKYGFIENEDYEVFNNFGENSKGGRPSTEYALSIGMAKELAMVENNERGRKVRRYFIEKEKEAKLARQYQVPQTFYEALMLAANQQKKIEEQKKMLEEQDTRIKSMEKKVTYYDRILSSTATMTMTQIAQDYGMSAQSLNQVLAKDGIQFKQSGTWILYAKYKSFGYVHSRPVEITRTNGSHDIKYNTEWTQKGRLFLYEHLKGSGILPMIERNIYNKV